jgi:hypothetical protein
MSSLSEQQYQECREEADTILREIETDGVRGFVGKAPVSRLALLMVLEEIQGKVGEAWNVLYEFRKKFKSKRPKGSISAATKHINDLAQTNRSQSAKQLFSIADKSIIGNMIFGTFSNHVSNARKVYPKTKSPTH